MAQLDPQAEAASLRRPKQLFTTGYLNDPIRFRVDRRFLPETLIREILKEQFIVRDQASFAVFEMNADHPQWYPADMKSPVYDRFDLNRSIKTQIKQLLKSS